MRHGGHRRRSDSGVRFSESDIDAICALIGYAILFAGCIVLGLLYPFYYVGKKGYSSWKNRSVSASELAKGKVNKFLQKHLMTFYNARMFHDKPVEKGQKHTADVLLPISQAINKYQTDNPEALLTGDILSGWVDEWYAKKGESCFSSKPSYLCYQTLLDWGLYLNRGVFANFLDYAASQTDYSWGNILDNLNKVWPQQAGSVREGCEAKAVLDAIPNLSPGGCIKLFLRTMIDHPVLGENDISARYFSGNGAGERYGETKIHDWSSSGRPDNSPSSDAASDAASDDASDDAARAAAASDAASDDASDDAARAAAARAEAARAAAAGACSNQGPTQGQNYYDRLGVGRDATDLQIKRAYRIQALRWHPDKHSDPGKKAEAEAKFKLINDAHSTLIDRVLRRDYNATLPRQYGTTPFNNAAGFGHSAPDFNR